MGTPGGARFEDDEGRMVGECAGPLDDGTCPRLAAGKAVPCAGHLVRPLASAGRAGWELRVSPTATACPLRSRRVWAKPPGQRWGPTTTTA